MNLFFDLLKLLKQKLSQKEYAQIKGAMWAFRKSPEQLKDSEWELLQRLFSHSPKMKEAYILREELTEIFERLYLTFGSPTDEV